MKTRDQEYALKSYETVSARIANMTPATKREYRTFAKRFPTLMHTCGLMQTMVFALAKGGTQLLVLEDFVAVLESPQVTPQQFVNNCQSMRLSEYMYKSRLAMRAAGWIKRQADALIEGEDAPCVEGGNVR